MEYIVSKFRNKTEARKRAKKVLNILNFKLVKIEVQQKPTALYPGVYTIYYET